MANKLNQIFKMLRNRTNLTSESIAEKTNISRSTIQRFEDGKNISCSNMIELFNSLGYTLVPVLTHNLEVSKQGDNGKVNQGKKKKIEVKKVREPREVREVQALRTEGFDLELYDSPDGKIPIIEGVYFNIAEDLFFDKKDMPIYLTRKEKEVALLAIRNPNTVITYADFEHYLWKYSEMSIYTLRNKIKKLRTKVHKGILRNHSGLGYEFKIKE